LVAAHWRYLPLGAGNVGFGWMDLSTEPTTSLN
jgi:hypothetical protein